ncbi:hypothetical protein FOM02_30980 [Bradyrhizobium sp. SEMIA]|nr:hypothetical protein FOM02_30980 [Bradyrhizobium sp. SEMIA]
MREIARRIGAAPSMMRLTIRRREAAGLIWPQPKDVLEAGCLPVPIPRRGIGAASSPTGRQYTASSSASM